MSDQYFIAAIFELFEACCSKKRKFAKNSSNIHRFGTVEKKQEKNNCYNLEKIQRGISLFLTFSKL